MESISYLGIDKINNLLHSQSSLREILIIRLLFELGCSFNELVNIRIRDIDFEHNLIRFNLGSREKRSSKISKKTKLLILRYIQNKGIAEKKLVYLLSARIRPLSTRRLNQILTKVLEGENPQILKYSHIINAYKQGISLRAIQAQVGLTRQRIIEILMSIDETDQDDYSKLFNNVEIKDGF